MSRTALKRFGQLALVALGMVVAVAPPAKADTEMASQCFYFSPYGYTMRVVRVASDQTPGVQAMFVQFRAGTSFQMLGTGVRATSLTTPPQKDFLISFVEPGGNRYRLTVLFDPASGTGPWTFYDDTNYSWGGTLVKTQCDEPGLALSGDDSGPSGPGLPR